MKLELHYPIFWFIITKVNLPDHGNINLTKTILFMLGVVYVSGHPICEKSPDLTTKSGSASLSKIFLYLLFCLVQALAPK